MTIEEKKAKAYDEALERARKLYEQGTITESLGYVFPELKESEDERIRKGLIKAVSRTLEGNTLFGTDVTREEALAWLEKQGEPVEIVKWSPQEESCICQLESLVKEQWRHAEKVNNAVDIKKMQELMFFLKTLNPNKKSKRMISAEAKEAMYDKPAWSEEDKDFMYDTLSNLTELKDRYGEGYGNVGKCIDWLKSLKQRIGE